MSKKTSNMNEEYKSQTSHADIDPGMDDILSSIRRIIAEDDTAETQTHDTHFDENNAGKESFFQSFAPSFLKKKKKAIDPISSQDSLAQRLLESEKSASLNPSENKAISTSKHQSSAYPAPETIRADELALEASSNLKNKSFAAEASVEPYEPSYMSEDDTSLTQEDIESVLDIISELDPQAAGNPEPILHEDETLDVDISDETVLKSDYEASLDISDTFVDALSVAESVQPETKLHDKEDPLIDYAGTSRLFTDFELTVDLLNLDLDETDANASVEISSDTQDTGDEYDESETHGGHVVATDIEGAEAALALEDSLAVDTAYTNEQIPNIDLVLDQPDDLELDDNDLLSDMSQAEIVQSDPTTQRLERTDSGTLIDDIIDIEMEDIAKTLSLSATLEEDSEPHISDVEQPEPAIPPTPVQEEDINLLNALMEDLTDFDDVTEDSVERENQFHSDELEKSHEVADITEHEETDTSLDEAVLGVKVPSDENASSDELDISDTLEDVSEDDNHSDDLSDDILSEDDQDTQGEAISFEDEDKDIAETMDAKINILLQIAREAENNISNKEKLSIIETSDDTLRASPDASRLDEKISDELDAVGDTSKELEFEESDSDMFVEDVSELDIPVVDENLEDESSEQLLEAEYADLSATIPDIDTHISASTISVSDNSTIGAEEKAEPSLELAIEQLIMTEPEPEPEPDLSEGEVKKVVIDASDDAQDLKVETIDNDAAVKTVHIHDTPEDNSHDVMGDEHLDVSDETAETGVSLPQSDFKTLMAPLMEQITRRSEDKSASLSKSTHAEIRNKPKEIANMANTAQRKSILDEVTETGASSAFASLNEAVEAEAEVQFSGPRVGDIVQEALRPMLKAWLDENLKEIVERAVAKEVQRIASGK